MGLTPINSIAAAQIAIYVPYFLIAILLASRHGFRRNAGWLYLFLFTLTRLVAASLQLSTASSSTPPSIGLLVTTQIFYSVGLSALILTLLNLLGRILSSIQQLNNDHKTTHHDNNNATTTTHHHKHKPFFFFSFFSSSSSSSFLSFTPKHQRLLQIVVLVGLILGIVGGSLTGSQIDDILSQGQQQQQQTADDGGGGADTGLIDIPIESQIGLGLLIAGFAGAAIGTLFCLTRYGQINNEKGDRRLLLAVAATVPFMVVRVTFSCLGIYGTDPRFRSFPGGSQNEYAWWFLGMGVMMEVVVVGILEGFGLTLGKVYPTTTKTTQRQIESKA